MLRGERGSDLVEHEELWVEGKRPREVDEAAGGERNIPRQQAEVVASELQLFEPWFDIGSTETGNREVLIEGEVGDERRVLEDGRNAGVGRIAWCLEGDEILPDVDGSGILVRITPAGSSQTCSCQHHSHRAGRESRLARRPGPQTAAPRLGHSSSLFPQPRGLIAADSAQSSFVGLRWSAVMPADQRRSDGGWGPEGPHPSSVCWISSLARALAGNDVVRCVAGCTARSPCRSSNRLGSRHRCR